MTDSLLSVQDLHKRFARLEVLTGIPTKYVIGKNGKIAASTIGHSSSDTFLEDVLTSKFGVTVKKSVAVR